MKLVKLLLPSIAGVATYLIVNKFFYMKKQKGGGKTCFLLMASIGVILCFTISSVEGLALLLEALYQIFKEGKISNSLYTKIVKALSKRWGYLSLPVEHLLEQS